VAPGIKAGNPPDGAPITKPSLVPMPSSRNKGPLLPLGSTARKSHGVRERVTSRAVGGPPNSKTVTWPVPVPDALGRTLSFTTHTPFQANPGSGVKSREAMEAFAQPKFVERKLGNC